MTKFIKPIKTITDVHLALFLQADPDEKIINSYIYRAFLFEYLYNDRVVGVLALDINENNNMEILNISIHPDYQKQGIGASLLDFADSFAKKQHYSTLEVRTGSTSIWQLYFYKKNGFRITEIIPNYFINNYKEPIYENGIQLKDQLLLKKELS